MKDDKQTLFKVSEFALKEKLAKAASGLWKFSIDESKDVGLSVFFEHRWRDEVYQYYDLEKVE